jgi:adenylate cyclase
VIAGAALRMPTGPAIAVLRFNNLSGPKLDFLSNAIADEIVTNLTRFSELRVAVHAVTRELGTDGVDVEHVARKLSVDFLVQGSLQRSGNRLRVAAQLLKTQDGRVLWGETYQRELSPKDIFTIQENIAGNVVATVASISGGVIAREAMAEARGKPPRELSAYECTTRANELMLTGFSAAAHLDIRNCLEMVVAREPDYSTAWALLAWVHSIEYSEGHNRVPGADPRERALAAGRRAVELAPANSLARFGMARAAYLAGELDLFRAEAAQALALNPHDPLLLGNIGNWLAFSGRWDQGVALVEKAIALSPKCYPRWWHAAIGKNLFRQGKYEAALAEFKHMDLPGWWWNQVEQAYTYGQLGDIANARKAVARLLALYPGFDLETAVREHRKFSFERSYIERAVEGLRKAGVPAGSPGRPARMERIAKSA